MIALFLSAMVGSAIVIQNGLNHRLAQGWGLPTVLVLNCVISLGLSLGLMAVMHWKPDTLPSSFQAHGTIPQSLWWVFIPGLSGFLIILGMPLAIQKVGVLRVLAIVIAVQLLGGTLWDLVVAGTPPTTQRVIGAVVTLAGALLALGG